MKIFILCWFVFYNIATIITNVVPLVEQLKSKYIFYAGVLFCAVPGGWPYYKESINLINSPPLFIYVVARFIASSYYYRGNDG